MRNLLTLLIVTYSLSAYSQCFECAKNIGGHTGDTAIDIEKTTDGIVYLIDANRESKINKYDFDCNLVWSIDFDYYSSLEAITSDELGNIYLVIHYRISTNAGLGPWNVNGFMLSPGLNFFKLNSAGSILWARNIGPRTGYNMQNIHYFQNHLLITGTFYDNLTFVNGLSFNFPYTNHPRAFIAKYDTDGNFINAINYGNGIDNFKFSEFDNQGNIYLTRFHFNSLYSNIDKFDASLQLSWTTELSNSNSHNTGIYIPTGLWFNNENNKLYVWGIMNLTTTILGNTFFVNNANGIFQSALTEFNSQNGTLTNIQRFDNNSRSVNAISTAVDFNPSAYMAEKNGSLYVLTSFRGTMNFPNGTVTSTAQNSNATLFSEDLLLFNVNLSNFSSEFILKSQGVPNLNYEVNDLPGPLVFNGDDLYITATFESNPIQINGSTINNNSGNNDPDAMYYKFNTNTASSSGTINVQNSCYNESTFFSLNGTYDSITWDFGDPSSANNTSTLFSPQHLFSSPGNYHVTATVICGNNTQKVEKDVIISNRPTLNLLNPITICETTPDSGISSAFDTSNLNSLLIGNQQNVILEFRNSNQEVLPSPLPNPFTNTTKGEETLQVRAYYTNNSDCYEETTIEFQTLTRPEPPTLTTPQAFCIQQNATLNDFVIDGQTLNWYDSAVDGNLLSNTTLLVNNTTYYASHSNSNCESDRVSVLVNIYNTPTPTGDSLQTFCSTQNATLGDIVVNGSNFNWFNSNTDTNTIPNTTLLIDGNTYYVSQVINDCESMNRLAVTVNLINTLNANDYSKTICDDLNDGIEIINLESYNPHFITSVSNASFKYYASLLGAMNHTSTDLIISPSNYKLTTGIHDVFVQITSSNGCHQVVKLTLLLVNKPIISIPDVVAICDKDSVLVNAGPSFDSYTWSNGSTSQTETISQEGTYSVTVTKNHENTICTTTKYFTVVLSNIATITNISIQDWTDTENVISVYISSKSYGNYEYSINGTDYQDSHVFSGLGGGEHTVYVRDKNDCGIAQENIFLLMYPKFFTPNGDGYNDTWSIKFSYIEPKLKISVFDRYGKLLKTLNNNTSWDGLYKGYELPPDDYWFVVTRENGKEYQGHFSLKK